MIIKTPVLKHRIRKVPKSFSWIDHRLVKDRLIDICSHRGAALYLFLVCVADARGLSYYGDRSLISRLSMDDTDLIKARKELVSAGLIAWKDPIYQVLSLEPGYESDIPRRTGSGMNLKDILQTAREVAHD